MLSLMMQCSRQQDLVQEGEDFLAAGDVDRAMERFETASRISDSPQGQAGIGVLLSLRRLTAVTGLTMMEKSLSRSFDFKVLGRLFTLYLDMGLVQRASESIAVTRIGEDRYFMPEVQILRMTLQCLNGARNVSGDDIRAVEIENEDYQARRQSYAGRCDVARLTRLVQGYYPFRLYLGRGGPDEDAFQPELYFLLRDPQGEKFEDGQKAWKEILALPEITRCEIQKIYGVPAELLNVKPETCTSKYTSSLVLLRETPPALNESDFFHFPDKLFDDSQFYPDFTPLPEYYYPGEPNVDGPVDDLH
tara:strand:- start:18117 stop:19031 length:915 start_codon:yes stop_codon:yes gene_type:complete